MGGTMSEEQRAHPRADGRKRVSVTVLSAPEVPRLEHHTFHCWTADLSAGGLRFCVHSNVPVGARLKLEITLDGDGTSFQHIARVMWRQQFEEETVVSNWLGIKILETLGGSAKTDQWQQLVAEQLPAEK
jgi:hypothetical protein